MSSLMSTKRTVRSRSWASSSQGETFASWSSLVQRISSPAPKLAAGRAREREESVVMFGPKTTSSPGAAEEAAGDLARRAVERLGAAARLVRAARVRVRGRGSRSTTASITSSGTCVPPGPSKKTRSRWSAEKRARAAATSRLTHATSPMREQLAPRAPAVRPALPVHSGTSRAVSASGRKVEPGGDRAVDRDELEGGVVGVGRRGSSTAGRSSPRRPARS